MAKIYAFREDRLGFCHELGTRAVLGRAPECDLLIFDRSASRHHAEIFMVDQTYFVADMGSTNGTLVNDQPVTIQTSLSPYDSIKIGQELFIFEPGLEVVVGPAPSALIVDNLSQDMRNTVAWPVAEAAVAVEPDDVPGLMALAHQLNRATNAAALEKILLSYIRSRFEASFMSVLWPAKPPVERLISLLTSHDDKRLLLSRTPFLRATRDLEVLLWPQSITELSFSEGQRNVTQSDWPSLVGPLMVEGGAPGLMYLENQEKNFTTQDLKAFAAMLGLVGSAISLIAEAQNKIHRHHFPASPESEYFLGSSDTGVKIVFATAAQAANNTGSILISGEAGTGKSALADFVHNNSNRRNGRLVTVNLATLPPGDIETTLFGQAHPGGVPQTGLVEMSDGGTLFLRHVEYLTPTTQKLLLMAIEERLFFTPGCPRAKAIDLRVISSTSIDLWTKVQIGYFREDLYSRLSHLNISMPPLRKIKHDLDNILNSFLNKSARDMGLPFTGLDPAALECLRAYNWPGNFAELRMESVLMVLFCRNGRVALEDLPLHLRLASSTFIEGDGDQPASPLIRESERHHLVRAMARCEGDLELVADLLNQRPEHIILKMRALGLDPIDYQPPVQLTVPKEGPGGTSLPRM